MSPSPLHGLNIVHRDPPPSNYLNDQQDLLSAPPFPDLAAQLELWTTLTFQSDDPLGKDDDKPETYAASSPGDGDKDDDEDETLGVPSTEGHVNSVNPTVIPTNTSQQHSQQQNNFDVNALLAGFGIDPFLVPPVPAPQQSQAASLAQLLASYPFPPNIGLQQQLAQASNEGNPPAKRARSRKASSAAATSPSSSVPQTPSTPNTTMESQADGGSVSSKTPLNAAEDKRRRNTAASARFRMKKKEREAALEKRSKELEGRVGELERECEALRRENGWLKGLVVGVTGAGAGVGVGMQGVNVPSVAPVSNSSKRKRDEDSSVSSGSKEGSIPASTPATSVSVSSKEGDQ